MPNHYFEQCKMDENNFKVFIGNQLLAITFLHWFFLKLFICENAHIWKQGKNLKKRLQASVCKGKIRKV